MGELMQKKGENKQTPVLSLSDSQQSSDRRMVEFLNRQLLFAIVVADDCEVAVTVAGV